MEQRFHYDLSLAIMPETKDRLMHAIAHTMAFAQLNVKR